MAIEHQGDFPHPKYSEYVLIPAFQEAKKYYYAPMIEANKAHVVMLQKSGIITSENARKLLDAIMKVEAEGKDARNYQPGVEDLFFSVENRIVEIAGAQFGGNLQLARSRNDLGYGLTRLAIRTQYLGFAQSLLNFMASVKNLAGDHLETIMPGYTHTQPAQPTTFAHYMAGVYESLSRLFEKLILFYRHNNRSPFGAAALTGTGFSIDRKFEAELLGFEDLIASTQDAIGSGDYLTDAAAIFTGLGVLLSRMSKDFIFWATQESGAIRIDDSFIQHSSIMPQKRNPVVIEHLRARISRLIALAQGINLQCHNIPYGDTQDVEDEMGFLLFNSFSVANDILDLYGVVLDSLQVNVERNLDMASQQFITVTELADTIVRELNLPFRQAHQCASRFVQYGLNNNINVRDLTVIKINEIIRDVSGVENGLTFQSFERAMDPTTFVSTRKGVGGSSPTATAAVLEKVSVKAIEHQSWLSAEKDRLGEASEKLQAEIEAI